jgi:hypothetical protein
VIEHIFAEAVALQQAGMIAAGRHRAVDRDRQRPPAGAGHRALAILERRQEGVAEKGIVGASAGIPVRRRETGDAAADPRDHRLAAHRGGTS